MNQNAFNRDEEDRDQLAEELVAYALGILEPAQRRVVEAQIAASPRLQERVQALAATVDQLGYSAPQVAPPPAVKSRLLARIAAEEAAPARAPSRVNPLRTTGGSRRRQNPLRQVQQQAQSWLDLATGWKLTTVAAVSALCILLAATYALQRELNQVSTTLATVQSQLTNLETTNRELQEINGDLQLQLQQQRTQLASLASVDQVVTLAANDTDANASGMLFVNDDSLTLLVYGLAPLPTTQTYQLWLIPDGSNPISSGLVNLTATEGPNLVTGLPREATEFAAVGLSIEPAAGSPQPTGPIVLLGTRTTAS